jgi:hypothetical protein
MVGRSGPATATAVLGRSRRSLHSIPIRISDVAGLLDTRSCSVRSARPRGSRRLNTDVSTYRQATTPTDSACTIRTPPIPPPRIQSDPVDTLFGAPSPSYPRVCARRARKAIGRFHTANAAWGGGPDLGRERHVGRGDRGVDPRPAPRAPELESGANQIKLGGGSLSCG